MIYILLCLMGATSDTTEAPGLTDLIHDRPQLLNIIQKGDPLWTWLNNRFTNTNGQRPATEQSRNDPLR